MAQKDIGNKTPLQTLSSTYQVRQYYDEWAENEKYDRDMVDWNYTGPEEAVRTIIKYAKSKDILIFDAGCGTGLVGKELNKAHNSNNDCFVFFILYPPYENMVQFCVVFFEYNKLTYLKYSLIFYTQ